ncbi:tetratricopeptide repeat protein [Dokdonia sp. Hel_I_53]|uniref:tetratricopeptide repeat protein n=1 Tax=Dokdonia sp. Hel_I_53 TaxID=1566287 RepID=UPI0011995F8A|nr:tetratricopeptide repeat protein [Dokdonia sp. Hel_I_53]TVZ53438.1 tetratricopeptide repeat protein [Dokdonia sp. Hel_I_53]
MHRIKFLLVAFILYSTISTAQQSAIYTNDLAKYNKALSLYNSEQYLASQTLFEEVQRESKDNAVKGDCAYYIANAAVRLNQQGADDLMLTFVTEYPTSTKRNSAFLDVASYYFENGKYAYARKWYDRVEEKNLSLGERETYNFNNGYAYFKSNRFDDAKKYFNRVRDSKKYGSQAKYYIGFMAYEGDDYESASELFDQVEAETSGEYNEDLAYFKADLNFKLGKFDEAITEGKSQLPKANPKEKSELNKIIGESYFNKENYAQALPYLKEYKGKRGKWNNTDYYQLGYAYYKQKDYLNAINEFNKIIDGRNSTAQNAYYHLAESYLKLEKKQEALNAFKNASEMNFIDKIKEDSGLNYAKLSYEIGNAYKPTPTVIADYLEEYPKTSAKAELEILLIDSYITSKNYKEAMRLLESKNNTNNNKAYQKVAFLYGLELFNEADYITAKETFQKSLKEPIDPFYITRATYWDAETDFVTNNFEQAIIGYKQFLGFANAATTPEYEDINYNLAYAYFSNKQYEQAATYFENYTKESKEDITRLNDAYLRLGDSKFISSKYWPALEAYNQSIALNNSGQDYATFQKSMSYGFINKNSEKIEGLQSFARKFPTSSYRDDALYELGNIYVSQNKKDQAVSAYNQLISDVPGSSYVSKALLKKALIYDNSNRSDEALTILKQVASDYPGTPEALQAVTTAKLIYIDLGRVNEYGQWVSTLDFIDVEDSELDEASYTQAEKQYLDNNTSQAEKLFQEYLGRYPNGQRALQSHFYLGQIAFAKAQYPKTIPHYQFVLERERNEFTEQALARLGQVFLTQKNYMDATPVLKRLETEADFPQNVIFAQSNLMKSYYEQSNYQEAISYAEKVLTNSKIDNKIKSDAQVVIARSSIQNNNQERAKKAYAEVRKIATGSLAAEALYYDAYFKNSEKRYKDSNTSVQKLAKEYSGYKEYGARGLVLMAKNFYGLGDAYQATYILESVTKNFTDFPDVVEEAKDELIIIKSNESKTNASVEEG